MLSTLHIENIALIENIDIEFGNGFIVFTGETGAGKSIVIDAIEMLLGGRTLKSIIRTGKDKATVIGSFCNISQHIYDILNSLDLTYDSDDMLIIQRVLYADGRNNCKINGKPVSISMLKQVTREIINIHGQNENQKLLNSENHIKYLDEFACNSKLLNEYKVYYLKAIEIRNSLKDLLEKRNINSNKLELLKFSINEITSANLQYGEVELLNEQKKIAQNTQKIKETIFKSNRILTEGDITIKQGIHDVMSQFSVIKDLKKEFGDMYSRLLDLSYEINDISDNILKMQDISKEDNIEEISQRLELIYKLRKKYGNTIEEILEYRDTAEKELNEINNYDIIIIELEDKLREVKSKIDVIAKKLTSVRIDSSKKLQEQITSELSFLDMPNVNIKVQFSPCEKFTTNGKEKVEFLISSNAGENLKPIAKIASGGEISRIMLALKSVLNNSDDADTLIFDEIDTGVSGKTAEKIGLKLKSLSSNKQVLCITHLAQIASLSDFHFLIYKEEHENKTYTRVKSLSYNEKVNELSRIIGGINITDTITIAAKEMLNKK